MKIKKNFLEYLMSTIKILLINYINYKKIKIFDKKIIKKIFKKKTFEKIKKIYNEVNKFYYYTKKNKNFKILFLLLSLKISIILKNYDKFKIQKNAKNNIYYKKYFNN